MRRYAYASKPTAIWAKHRMEIEKDSPEFAGMVVEVLSELGNDYLHIFNYNDDSSIDCNTIFAKLESRATCFLIEIIRNSTSKRNCVAAIKSWLIKSLPLTDSNNAKS